MARRVVWKDRNRKLHQFEEIEKEIEGFQKEAPTDAWVEERRARAGGSESRTAEDQE